MKGLSLINRFLSKKVFLECDFEVDFLKGGLSLKVLKKSKGPTRSKKVRP